MREADRSREFYETGRSHLEAGRLEEAIENLERSVAEYPHFKALELLGEAWLRCGQPVRALVPLAAATTLNAQVRAPSLLAEALLAAGEEIDAHRVARLALDRDTNNKRAKAVYEATLGHYTAWAGR